MTAKQLQQLFQNTDYLGRVNLTEVARAMGNNIQHAKTYMGLKETQVVEEEVRKQIESTLESEHPHTVYEVIPLWYLQEGYNTRDGRVSDILWVHPTLAYDYVLRNPKVRATLLPYLVSALEESTPKTDDRSISEVQDDLVEFLADIPAQRALGALLQDKSVENLTDILYELRMTCEVLESNGRNVVTTPPCSIKGVYNATKDRYHPKVLRKLMERIERTLKRQEEERIAEMSKEEEYGKNELTVDVLRNLSTADVVSTVTHFSDKDVWSIMDELRMVQVMKRDECEATLHLPKKTIKGVYNARKKRYTRKVLTALVERLNA